jgi:hypothetical protein
MNVSELPRDLDGWPYLTDSPIGPWKVSPCCGAFVEWSAADGSGVGDDLLTCKRCYQPAPEGFRDERPRLGDEPPRPPREPFRLTITPTDGERSL